MFLSRRDFSGQRGLSRLLGLAAAVWASLVLGLVDVVVNVANVLVGSGRTPMLAWISTRLKRAVGGPGRLGRLVDQYVIVQGRGRPENARIDLVLFCKRPISSWLAIWPIK